VERPRGIAWASAVGIAGYALGASYERAAHVFSGIGIVIGALFALWVLYALARHFDLASRIADGTSARERTMGAATCAHRPRGYSLSMRLHHHRDGQPLRASPEQADSVVDQLAGAKMREALAASAEADAAMPRVLILDGDIADGLTGREDLAAVFAAQHGALDNPFAGPSDRPRLRMKFLDPELEARRTNSRAVFININKVLGLSALDDLAKRARTRRGA
jgi:hypothetical protein